MLLSVIVVFSGTKYAVAPPNRRGRRFRHGPRRANVGALAEGPDRVADGNDGLVEVLGREEAADAVDALRRRFLKADAVADAPVPRYVPASKCLEEMSDPLGALLGARSRESAHAVKHFRPFRYHSH